jgi:hypothetical protein
MVLVVFAMLGIIAVKRFRPAAVGMPVVAS